MEGAGSPVQHSMSSAGQDLGGCVSLKADVKHIHIEVSKVKKSHTNVCDRFKDHFI